MRKIDILFWISMLPMSLFAQSPATKYDVTDIAPFQYNTTQSEFGVSIVGDTLYYVKMDEGRKPKKSFFHLHKVALNADGKVTSEPVFENRISSQYHNGPLCYSPAMGCYLISRSSSLSEARVENKVFRKRVLELKIDMYNPTTGEIVPFPYNSPSYSVAHPALNAKGDVLYFSSDMPGGYGGKDLYRSVYQHGAWSTPENLGNTINSEKDEVFPSVGANQDLLFASNRDGGLGGLDIYLAQYVGTNDFSAPVLLSEPINSAYDDFAFLMAKNSQYALLSSNRAGLGDDDLYQMKIKLLEELKQIIEGLALNSETGKVMPKTSVNLFAADSMLIASTTTDENGKFSLNLEDDKVYQLFANDVTAEELTSDKLAPWFKEVNGSITDGSGKPVSAASIQLLQQDNVVAASTPTNKKGDFTLEINQDTSAKLLANVKNNQVSKQSGIYDLHLVVQDADSKKTMSNFIARNLTDGRVWKGSTDKNEIRLVSNANNQLRIESEGYLLQRITIDTRNMAPGAIVDTVALYVRDGEKLFELGNINYDYDKWTLKEEAKRELDKLVSIMKENTEIYVTFRSHTDSRGSEEYNMYLSKERSNSCRQYLVDQGIALNRITARGFGESQLLNACANDADCSEEMHYVNRRTEVQFNEHVNAIEKERLIKEKVQQTGNRFFILAGSFRNEYLADYYYDDMKYKGYNVLKMGKIRGGLYGVALEGCSDLKTANERVKELRKQKGFEDAWIYDYGRY